MDYAVVRGGCGKDMGTPKDILEVIRLILDYKFREAVIRGKVKDGAVVEGRIFVDEGCGCERVMLVRDPAYIGKNTVIEPDVHVDPYTSIEMAIGWRGLRYRTRL